MLITSADLKTQTKADLAQMAKRLGVSAWNTLSKDQLVAAIIKHKKSGGSKPAAKSASRPSGRADSKSSARVTVRAAAKAEPGKGTKKGTAAPASKAKPAATAAKKVAASKAKPEKKTPGKIVSTRTEVAAKKSKSDSKSGTQVNGSSSHSAKANGTVSKPISAKAPVAKAKTAKVEENKAAKKPVAAKKVVPKKPSKPTEPPTDPSILQRIREIQEHRESTKDLAKTFEEVARVEIVKPEPPPPPPKAEGGAEETQQKDRIVLVVRDAYWLQVTWDITRRAVERARAAMAEHWHHAQPILRLLRLDDSGTTSAAETIERDIVIHGGVRNWYIDLNGTPGRFRVMIGYLSGTRFHMLAKSNIVRTPTPGTTDAVEDHWSDIARDAERIFALSGGYDSEQRPRNSKRSLKIA